MSEKAKIDPTWAKMKKKMYQEHGGRVLQGMTHLWQSNELCDYTLTAGNRTFKVHRMYLAATSDYFYALLTNGMMETQKDTVNLKGVTAEGLEPLLNFLYTGDLEIDVENALDILDAASHLQVHSVLKLCLAFLTNNTTVDNCVDVLNLSKLYSTDPIHIENSENFVAANFSLVVSGEHHKRLTLESFTSLLMRDDLLYGPEMFLFYVILDWVKEDEKERKQHGISLVTHIRFALMSKNEIKTIRNIAPHLWEDKTIGALMLEALVYIHRPTHQKVTMQTKLTKLRAKPVVFVTVDDEDNEQRMYELNVKKNEWKDFHPPEIEPVLGNPTGLAVVENFLVCLGERIPNHNEVEEEFRSTPLCKIYDPRDRTWSEMAPLLRKYHYLETIVVHDGHIYLVEGYDDFGPDVQDCRIERYSFAENKWEIFARMYDGWPLVHSMGACVMNNRLYVAGGCSRHAVSNQIASIDLKTRQWKIHQQMNLTKAYHQMFPVDNRILFVDGTINGEDSFDMKLVCVDYYDPERETWEEAEVRYVKSAGAKMNLSDSRIFTNSAEVQWYAQLIPQADSNKVTLKKLSYIPNSFDCNPHFVVLEMLPADICKT